MANVFSDKVQQALEYIYYNERAQKGQEGFALLEEAVKEGDADAMCILARCYCGSQYVWAGHNFPEDDHKATKLLHQSAEKGSAIGVLVALRSGELTPSIMKKMPFASIQEAFDQVEKMAVAGDAFCQYTVANSYFWWDFLRIQNKGRESFSSDQEFRNYLKENILKCEDWFWKAYRGGIFFAGNNLKHFYEQGDEDLIPPQPEKGRDVYRIGAEYGYPVHQYNYAEELEKTDPAASVYWYQQAAESGMVSAWYDVGYAYDNGTGVEKDPARAAECFEKCLNSPCSAYARTGSAVDLGALLYWGKGVPRDYARAWMLFCQAKQEAPDRHRGDLYLARCAFYGQGTQQDYALAWKFLSQVDWENSTADYMRGYLYCNGLGGVPEDIKTGVAYLQKSGTDEAKEELLKYKKTFFGKWVRR